MTIAFCLIRKQPYIFNLSFWKRVLKCAPHHTIDFSKSITTLRGFSLGSNFLCMQSNFIIIYFTLLYFTVFTFTLLLTCFWFFLLASRAYIIGTIEFPSMMSCMIWLLQKFHPHSSVLWSTFPCVPKTNILSSSPI